MRAPSFCLSVGDVLRGAGVFDNAAACCGDDLIDRLIDLLIYA
jgi:hypothetical protein